MKLVFWPTAWDDYLYGQTEDAMTLAYTILLAALIAGMSLQGLSRPHRPAS